MSEKNKTLTTPDPITLHKTLRDLSDKGFTHVVMEVSSHALDQLRVADIDFDISVFTNLSNEHLDYHIDMETYFKTKSNAKMGLNLSRGEAIKYYSSDRIAQLVISKHESINWEISAQLGSSKRGMSGFGSTGLK